MNKNSLIDKITSIDKVNKANVLKLIAALPNEEGPKVKVKPNAYKKGDVLFHQGYNHPCVLIKKKKEIWLACLLTSNPDCAEVIEQCDSRFFNDSYFTFTLIQISTSDPKFMSVFENMTQLNRIFDTIKARFK